MDATLLTTLFLGLTLGVEHALDADHVVAVSTILSQNRHPLKAALVGAYWGIGHTLTLFIVGMAVIFLKLRIPNQLALSMEFMVGVVLFVLAPKSCGSIGVSRCTHTLTITPVNYHRTSTFTPIQMKLGTGTLTGRTSTGPWWWGCCMVWQGARR